MPTTLLTVALVLIGLLALGFAILVVSSMRHDPSNPRRCPHSYYFELSMVVVRPVDPVYHLVQYRTSTPR